MNRFLVCPPDYFNVDYEINPWMRLSNRVNPDQAQQQWQGLVEELEHKIGATLERMQPVPGLPDLVFTANAGAVSKGQAVVSRFKHPERQREEPYFEQWFREHGYRIEPLDEGLHFEGAGDLLGFPGVWFGAYRQRSDIGAYHQLGKIFDQRIIPLELVDARFYHLDTCFCPLREGELLYYPKAFDAYGQTAIRNEIDKPDRFEVPEPEALRFACNAVCVEHHVVLPQGCPETERWLQNRGYFVHALPLDEFMKSGGSAKCLTLALDSSSEVSRNP